MTEVAQPSPSRSVWSTLREAVRGSHQDYTEAPIGRAVVLLAVPMVLEMLGGCGTVLLLFLIGAVFRGVGNPAGVGARLSARLRTDGRLHRRVRRLLDAVDRERMAVFEGLLEDEETVTGDLEVPGYAGLTVTVHPSWFGAEYCRCCRIREYGIVTSVS